MSHDLGPPLKPRLPLVNNKDGDQIIDTHGNVWEYNLERNEWIYRGVVPDPETVTETEDGLVPPDLLRKMVLLQELMERGFDFSAFKIANGANPAPYYYYFNSGDGLIDFIPEKHETPKEVRFADIIIEVISSVANNQTQIKLLNNITMTADAYAGLFVEGQYGTYKILTNDATSLTLEGGDLNLLARDEIKVVKPLEIKHRLRLEVDRSRLIRRLTKGCCVGPKGPKGEKGAAGRDGIPADDEVFLLPTEVTGGLFQFSATVETPITTPISLRLFTADDDDNHLVEVLFPLQPTEGVKVAIVDDTIDVVETEMVLSYDPTTLEFKGTIPVVGADISGWRYKARQRGRKGDTGEPGKPFFELVEQTLDDPALRSSEAIVSARKAVVTDDIIVLRADLFSDVPVSNLGALDGDSIRDLEDVSFAAAKVTIREAKDIGFFKFEADPYTTPPLDLPQWTPTSDCVQARRWGQYKFDWFNKTDPKYLFTIFTTPKPPEQCCQEDFFFCPNVGDQPCGITGEVPAPQVNIPCVCECEVPIEDQPEGSRLALDPVDLTQDSGVALVQPSEGIPVVGTGAGTNGELLGTDSMAASQTNSAQGVVNGTPNEFSEDIFICGRGEIRITVEFDSTVCGGEVKERAGCAYVDACAVMSQFTLTDLNNVSSISSDGNIETQSIPVTAVFTVETQSTPLPDDPPEPPPGQEVVPYDPEDPDHAGVDGNTEGVSNAVAHLQLNAIVNSTGLDLCRGYRITVTSSSEEIICERERTWIFRDPTRLPPPEETRLPPPEDPTEAITGTSGIPYIPEESFADAGVIVDDESETLTAIQEFISESDNGYGLSWGVTQSTISSVSDDHIIVDGLDCEIGSLTNGAGIPLSMDHLQNNALVSIGTITLPTADAAYDTGGPYGVGTYVLASDFQTTWSSRIPNVDIRTDQWTNVVAFFEQPTVADESTLTIIGTLGGSSILNTAPSYFTNHLQRNPINTGMIVITIKANQDMMGVINAGQIMLSDVGSVQILYGDVQQYLPDTVIEPSSPPSSEPSSPSEPGSEPLEVLPLEVTDQAATTEEEGAESFYGFYIKCGYPVLPDDQLWVTFPGSFNMSPMFIADSLSGIDGTFDFEVDGQTVKVIRQGDGTTYAANTQFGIVLGAILNGPTGSYTFSIEQRSASGELKSGPGTSAAIQFSEEITVSVLQIDGENFPVFQFTLASPDSCPSVHYHSAGPVCSFEGTTFPTDPNPGGCGYGASPPLSPVSGTILQHDYDEWLACGCPYTC
jgi:hypothetical protein